MKTRIIVLSVVLFMITVLLSRNDAPITDMLLGAINPIKQKYQSFTQEIEDKSQSYIFQKESIERLSHENRILRKRLLEQMHYIDAVKSIYETLPYLDKIPVSSISIVETISYVKLNSFSQIILTKPKDLVKDKLYGIIQKHLNAENVVAGIAKVMNNQLYGYLTSDEKCRFSVYIGESNAPGIALGNNQNKMIVKFIPKWNNIQVGDKVRTSGLDDIFFVDIPVGIVTKVEVQSSYTVAHIKTYSDIFHPKTFFLINNASPTLTEGFDNKQITTQRKSLETPSVSSIPRRIDQTQEQSIDPNKANKDNKTKNKSLKKTA